MNRRSFSLAMGATGFGLGLGLTMPSLAQTKWQEGVHFARLPLPPAPTFLSGDKKVEVVNFFQYGCKDCFDFEPLISEWVKDLPPDVQFRSIPVGWSTSLEYMQRLYFTLETLGALEKLHSRVFKLIFREPQRAVTNADLGALLAEEGIDWETFNTVRTSFGVTSKVAQSKSLAEAYRVRRVPTIGIHGRFITDFAMAGGHTNALQLTGQIIHYLRTK